MGVGGLFKSKPLVAVEETSGASTPAGASTGASTPARSDISLEKNGLLLEDGPVKYLTLRAFVLGLVVSMGGTVFGYSTGQISGFTTMPNFKKCFGEYNTSTNEYEFSNMRNGLIVGLLAIGTMVGALLAAPIADRVGRKLSISFWAFINMVGIVVQMSTDSKWYQVAMGRWVAGLGIGAISALVPMYQSESAPCHVRGAMVSSFQLCVTLGIFLSYIVNLGTNTIQSTASWRITMGIGFAWSLILGIGTLFLPESPRFAYCRGRFEEARIVMSQLYGVSQNHRVVAQEMQEMEEKFIEEKTTAGPAPWYEVFTGPRMFYRTMLGIVVQSLQQLTGANFLFYYGNSVFSSAGLDNSYVTQVILGAVNFGMTFPGLYMVEHFGRRKCLIYGGLWMFICFMIFASVGHFGLAVNSGSSNPTAGTVMIVFTCFFICGYSTTWGPIVYTICGEMYPARYRAVSIGIATAANWTWNFLISFFTPFITSAIDFRYGYVFGSCCFAGAIIVFFFVNETQGRSLEEIDTMYLSRVKPWKSSSWTAPESVQAQDLQARLEATVSRGEARGETHPPSTPAELSD